MKGEIKNKQIAENPNDRHNLSKPLHDYGRHKYKVKFEYNYNQAVTPDAITNKQAKRFIRLTIDDKTAYIQAEDLYFLMYAIADDETQVKMLMTQTETIVSELKFIKNIKFDKPHKFRKGDILRIPLSIPLTKLEEAALLMNAQRIATIKKIVKKY